MASTVMKITWEDLPRSESNLKLTDGMSAWQRSGFATEKAQFIFNWLQPGEGSMVPHVHDFDQFALILEGRVLMLADGVEYVVSAGEMLFIPAGVHHCGKAYTEGRTLNLDIFCPPRDDYRYIHDWQDDRSADTPGVTFVGSVPDGASAVDTPDVPR